jgi:apolipoprotein N-acyltransferase
VHSIAGFFVFAVFAASPMSALSIFFESRVALWLAAPVGAALALAFAPFGAWPLAVLCPAYLFLLWLHSEPRRAGRAGFLFTVGLFLAGTYWLYATIHVVGKAPAWIAIFLMFGMVAILGGYTAALGYALARWLPGKVGVGAQMGAPLRLLAVYPAAYVLLEWFRGWFLSGFPWFALGYSQTDSPLAAFAPIAGVYGMSSFTALSAGAMAALIATRHRIAAGLVLIVIWGAGFALWHRDWTASSGRPITVAVVQGAVPQDLKWSLEYRDSTIRLYRDLTLPHLGKDVILWPEAALPDTADQLTKFISYIGSEADAHGSTLVTGMLRYGENQHDVRNSLLVLGHTPQWYDKRRLVPFGEFFPVPAFVRSWMRLQNLPHSDITPGAADQPALTVGSNKIGVTICYEDAYGAEQLNVLKEATLLVNVTNDAWFGDTTAAPQHLQISRLRAMEAQRPMLRAANDGISAVIEAQGRVASALPRFEPAVLTGVVQPRSGLTPYARVGNWPVILLCGFALVAAALIARKRQASV